MHSGVKRTQQVNNAAKIPPAWVRDLSPRYCVTLIGIEPLP
jgi:hypothetical protein